jgi:predicted phosphodiesterase
MNDKGTSINILLLSDTHGHIDKNILAHAAEVDEIWHAGDI